MVKSVKNYHIIMKFLKKYKDIFESISIFKSDEWSKLLPSSLTIVSDTGEWTLKRKDTDYGMKHATNVSNIMNCLQITYNQNTVKDVWDGDVLKDGEPDFLNFDINMVKKNDGSDANPDTLSLDIDITYGDAMIHEFTIDKNGVMVGNYNGYDSKFDPKTRFGFSDESLENLIKFFNSFGFNHNKEDFSFIDKDLDSYRPTGKNMNN